MSSDADGRRPARRRRARPRSTSSTRRCATAPSSRASRSPSRTSCASPSSSTGSASRWIEGGYPQANPKDEEFFRRAPTELQLETADAGRLRLDPPARPARSTSTRRCARWSRPARRPRASSASLGLPRHRGAAAPPSTRAWPWSATRCAFLQGAGPAGVLRRRALLRRLQGATPSSPCGCSRPRPPNGAECARAVRHQRRLAAPRGASAIVGEVVRLLRRRPADRHPHPERHRLRGGQLGRRRASAAPPSCRARSTATASAPATPTS